MLNTNSDTLRRVFQAALNLQPRSSACWTAILLSAFQGLRGCELYVRAVQTGHAITMQEFTADLLIYLYIGTYRLSSSHARLEAFVIQTKPIHAQFQYQFSTSAVGHTDQTSRLYTPVSVVSQSCSNSSCPCVSNLSDLFVWVLPF
jgi:hypothetical protein